MHQYFLDQAYLQAVEAFNKHEVPVGCVVVHNNKIVSRSHNWTNLYSTPLAHAELNALKNLLNKHKDLNIVDKHREMDNQIDIYINNNIDIYIDNNIDKDKDFNDQIDENCNLNNDRNMYCNNLDYQINSNKLIFYITCEPCVMCLGILERINCIVYYGCKNGIFGGTSVINQKKSFLHNLNDKRCYEILQRFYKRENLNAPKEFRKKKLNL